MQGLRPGSPPVDTDDDGMPDGWENEHGLDPKDPSDASKTVAAGASADDRHRGYTYIEYYVNDLADSLIADAVLQTRKG